MREPLKSMRIKRKKELEIQRPYHEKQKQKADQHKITPKVFSTEGSLDPALSSENNNKRK